MFNPEINVIENAFEVVTNNDLPPVSSELEE